MNGNDPNQQQHSQVPQQMYRRPTPQSELDLSMMTTDSTWGRPNDINPDLRGRLRVAQYVRDDQGNIVNDEDGKPVIDERSLWEELDFYTRDLRLANLDGEELKYCRYYLDLAGDVLSEKMYGSFRIALARAASVLELSQSKKGFLRKMQNTIRQETTHQELEPPRKNLFGGMKKQE